MDNRYNGFADFLAKGRNKENRTLANNTRVRKEGDNIVITLHNTDIITYYPNGDIRLNSGGWKTLTTKERLNDFSPFRVWQAKGLWTVCVDGKSFPFSDNMLLTRNGDSWELSEGETDNKEETKLRNKIQKYTRQFMEEWTQGKIPLPNNGDCWYCLMREEKTGLPLGEVTHDTEHLLSHMEEEYFVPSLFFRAVEWGTKGSVGWLSFFVREWRDNKPVKSHTETYGRYLRSYLYRQFGLASRLSDPSFSERRF